MTEHIARRLTVEGPKRMLALDGGGTRGMLSIAFLEVLEQTLQRRLGRGDDFVLADYFDMIGGTSVGSILATELALGARVADIKPRFEKSAREIFRGGTLGLISHMFRPEPLKRNARKVVGDATLGTERLKTGLTIIMKRMDRGSVWPVSNNPAARYWEPRSIPGSNRVRLGNKDYLLWELIRSSTAAPRYFPHKKVRIFEGIDDGEGMGHFIDGSVSPHNNPALQMFMMAGIKGYNLGGGVLTKDGGGKAWKLGEKNLLLVSIGTGLFASKSKSGRGAALDAIASLQGMIADGTDLGLLILQWLGKSNRPWALNRDVRTLAEDGLNIDGDPVGPLLTFQRYDLRLDRHDLNLDRCAPVKDGELEDLQNMVEPANMQRLYDLGSAAALKQISADDFPSEFGAVWRADAAVKRAAE